MTIATYMTPASCSTGADGPGLGKNQDHVGQADARELAAER